MPNQPIPIRGPRPRRGSVNEFAGDRKGNRAPDLLDELKSRLVGQVHAVEQIVPYVRMHRAGLAPEGRPVGVFLLLGPTGIGKTKTVEALADALHGSERQMLRIDCGEFQMEHEVAKLIGAPPGYLGHRETQPIVTQQRLNAVTSENSNLSLVLFDEIEKAAPSMTRLLLSVLDKAVLRLGDNTQVNFERSMIFLSSNLGAEAMRKLLAPDFGFEALSGGAANEEPATGAVPLKRLEKVARNAVRRRFAPEFVNRIDAVITYQPLDCDAMRRILDQQLHRLQVHIRDRLENESFELELDGSAREFLLDRGTSREYGARELKRTILRQLTQPLAEVVEGGEIAPGSLVRVSYDPKQDRLRFKIVRYAEDSIDTFFGVDR